MGHLCQITFIDRHNSRRRRRCRAAPPLIVSPQSYFEEWPARLPGFHFKGKEGSFAHLLPASESISGWQMAQMVILYSPEQKLVLPCSQLPCGRTNQLKHISEKDQSEFPPGSIMQFGSPLFSSLPLSVSLISASGCDNELTEQVSLPQGRGTDQPAERAVATLGS